MTKHWSFIVCDKKYLYPLAGLLLVGGLAIALQIEQALPLNIAGALVTVVGAMMAMRRNFREGLNRNTNAADSAPVLPGTNQLNVTYFNNLTFGLGDARLQRHGLLLAVLGTLVGVFGDLILKLVLPHHS